MNKFKEPGQQEETEKKETVSRKRNMVTARKFIRFLNVFNVFDRGIFVRSLPFIFFLMVLGLVYIANSYYSEKTIREIDKTNREIKELKSEYVTTKSELMQRSIQSEVAKDVLPLGIKQAVVSPKKIIDNK